MSLPPLPTPTYCPDEIGQMDLPTSIGTVCHLGSCIGARASMATHLPPQLVRSRVYPSLNSLTASLAGVLDRIREIVSEENISGSELDLALEILTLYSDKLFVWSDATVHRAAKASFGFPVVGTVAGIDFGENSFLMRLFARCMDDEE